MTLATGPNLEWRNLVAGLTLIVSPWLLGFQDTRAVTIDVAIAWSSSAGAFEVWLLLEAWRDHGEASNRCAAEGPQLDFPA